MPSTISTKKSWAFGEIAAAIPSCKNVKELAERLGVSTGALYSRAHKEQVPLRKAYPKISQYPRALYSKYWYQNNKNVADTYAKNWRQKKRLAIIQKFGGQCKKCGIANPVLLDFDHLENDGHKDSKKNIIFRVQENPKRFQLLCKNCNWLKEYERRKNALN